MNIRPIRPYTVLHRPTAPVERMTVPEFVALGGKVQVIPPTTGPTVYPPRRPVAGPGVQAVTL